MQRNGFKAAKFLVLQRLQQFIKRQQKPGGNKADLLQYYLPRAETLNDSMSSLTAAPRMNSNDQQQQHVCTECGSLFFRHRGTQATLAEASRRSVPIPEGAPLQSQQACKGGNARVHCLRTSISFLFLFASTYRGLHMPESEHFAPDSGRC